MNLISLMGLSTFIPEIGKKNSSKDIIINILINNYPLSLKKIYNKAKRDYSFSSTYQSVFKAVNELLDKKVLIKKGNEYEINVSWIKNLQSFTDIVETNYYAKKTTEFNPNIKKDTLILNFESVFDAEKYLYYFVKTELKKLKNEKIVYETNNEWKVLFYYRAEYNYYTKLMKLGHKLFFLCYGNSQIEKHTHEFYKKIGIQLRKKQLEPNDSIIFSDYFIKIFIQEKLKEQIKECLNKEEDFKLLNLLNKTNETIKIIIYKDKELANEMKKQTLKQYFK